MRHRMLDLTQFARNTRFKRHRNMRKLSWSLKCLHRWNHGIIVPIALGMQHDRVITLSSLILKPWQKIRVESKKTYRESIVTVGSFNIALGFILVLGLLPRTFLPGTMMSAEYPTLVQRRSLVEFFQSQKVQTAVCIFTIYQDISYSKMFSYTL